MNRRKKDVYEFHFKMDSEMKTRLEEDQLYRNAGCLSKTIVRILTFLSPQIEKILCSGEQKESKYEFVNNDKTIVRESVHVFLPESIYMKLKLMHHNLNYYSIAQLLRAILKFYLFLVKVYSDSIITRLQSFYKYWKKKLLEGKHRWKPVRQLLLFIYQKPRISRYLILYSRKSSPIGIFRM